MFEGDGKQALFDINLDKLADFESLSKSLATRLELVDDRKKIVHFVNSLLSGLEPKLKNEDYQSIQTKTTVIINGKIKQSKSKPKKEKTG